MELPSGFYHAHNIRGILGFHHGLGQPKCTEGT